MGKLYFCEDKIINDFINNGLNNIINLKSFIGDIRDTDDFKYAINKIKWDKDIKEAEDKIEEAIKAIKKLG